MREFSVLLATRNRAALLRDTLSALSRLTYGGNWETVVVDNNSTDDTATVVHECARTFPVPLRYVFEPTPGKYFALNAGIRTAQAAFIAATDDDAYPAADWLDRAREALVGGGYDFVGGPVHPLWRGMPPRWLKAESSIAEKVLGLQDHGPQPREYGRGGISWPLGVNVAYRRDAFDRVGYFEGRLGRLAGTLRNQSQREWHLRARSAGLRGQYLPAMIVHHLVSADRLTRRYFHRWFYWHGISRGILYRMHGSHLLEPEGDATHASERHLLGTPQSVWVRGARAAFSAGWRWVSGQSDAALDYELMVCFCAGVIRQRSGDRSAGP